MSNQVLDLGLLAQTATAAMGAVDVERIEAVADRGYFKIEDIEACEATGVTAYVPKPIRGPAVREGFFGKDVFRYEPDRDVFICLAGAVLLPRYQGKSRDNVKVDYANRDACKVCALRSRCTRSFRRVSRLENEAVLDRMGAQLAARPDMLDHRRNSVEHPFGTIKQWMGQPVTIYAAAHDFSHALPRFRTYRMLRFLRQLHGISSWLRQICGLKCRLETASFLGNGKV